MGLDQFRIFRQGRQECALGAGHVSLAKAENAKGQLELRGIPSLGSYGLDPPDGVGDFLGAPDHASEQHKALDVTGLARENKLGLLPRFCWLARKRVEGPELEPHAHIIRDQLLRLEEKLIGLRQLAELVMGEPELAQ